MGSHITLWRRADHLESDDAQRYLRKNGFAADRVLDIAVSPPNAADLAAIRKGLGGSLAGAIDLRHPDAAAQTSPANPMDGDQLLARLLANPTLLRAPILLTPKGALAGFRERAWAKFLGVGADHRG